MNLTDKTYFEHLNIVANINEPDPDSKTDKELIARINEGEKYVLMKACGWKMLDEIKELIKDGFGRNAENSTLPQEYKDLIFGATYTKNQIDYHWEGLIQPFTKTSLLADFIYCIYHDNNLTKTTGIGEVSIEGKAGGKASFTPKYVKTWNKFLKKFNGSVGYGVSGYTAEGNPFRIISNRLGNGYGVDYRLDSQETNVCLIQFLKDNEEQFPLLKISNEIYSSKFNFENEWGI